MDNDNAILKKIKYAYKKTNYYLSYQDVPVLDSQSGNKEIGKLIETKKSAMIARCGATEVACIREYLHKRKFSLKLKERVEVLSGVFPADDSILYRFCELYLESLEKADIMAVWLGGTESRIIKRKCPGALRCEAVSLEPYYFNNPWSGKLKGKRVLVVHPFADTIRKQYENRRVLFDNKDILPDFASLECICAVQSAAGEVPSFFSWFEALEHMKKQILICNFDVAIIGAGAYGLPLAAWVKTIGKIGIQMAGATQILFGIKGKRWDNHSVISKLYNDAWVRPSKDETPRGNSLVEGGSYW